MNRRLLLVLFFLPLLLSIAATCIFNARKPHPSLFELGNYVGPTAYSLLHREGLTVCDDGLSARANPICFHAGRMPLASLVVAAGIRLFGDQVLPVNLFKTILFLLPLLAAILLIVQRLAFTRSLNRRLLTVFLLLLPFAALPFLADVVNLQVEEGYSYSFLALAAAILFTLPRNPPGTAANLRAVALAVSIAAVYLAKSAMAPAALVLVIGFLLRERRLTPRLLLIVLSAAAPVGWALHQHHAAGRYSLGTSIDGINLHKGNNPGFLSRYPPPPGDTLDRFDADLSAGQAFPDEWTFNDFHQKAAIAFIRTHPHQTAQADVRKLDIIFFSLRKVGSSEDSGLRGALESVGILILRVALWSAIILSFLGILRRTQSAFPGTVFLALIAACSLPYVLGFAYTRHVSILLYPSILLCCTILTTPPPECRAR